MARIWCGRAMGAPTRSSPSPATWPAAARASTMPRTRSMPPPAKNASSKSVTTSERSTQRSPSTRAAGFSAPGAPMRMRYTVGLQDRQVLQACAEAPGRVHGVPDSRSLVPGNETAVTDLRSAQWYAGGGRNAYLHRAWMRRGLPASAFSGRPHIAIANTASDLTPCNAHLDELAASVRDGIHEAGGIPLNLPVVSLGETNVRPTAMLWRNMAAMATEEMLRANPVDGVVLLGGCDKTIPSLLMAAASVDLPAVVVPGGPMLSGTFRGVALGCGTDVWRLSEEVRAGKLSGEEFLASESSMIRSRGHCNTMGTASTMGLLTEVLGMTLPGTAGLPAPDSRLLANAQLTGRLIVDMVAAHRTPSQVLTAGSFHNAIVALAALGGSTNAVVHLLAIAGRLGVPLVLDDFDRIGAQVPLLVDLQPTGRFLMDDLYRAGGLSAVLREVADLLDPDAITVTGEPFAKH